MKSKTLEPNQAAALSYVLGFVSGLVFLLVEKHDKFVRFHAMQSVITFLLLSLVRIAASGLPFLGSFFIAPLVNLLGLVLWVILIVKAYQGEEYELPLIGSYAREWVQK